jgi:hypothetical protein
MITKIHTEVRKGWEHRFPDLSGIWTHWKIMGDGGLIEVVNGIDLIKALHVVEQHFGQFSSIKVCRASVDENGNLDKEEKALFEISHYIYDLELINSTNEDNT